MKLWFATAAKNPDAKTVCVSASEQPEENEILLSALKKISAHDRKKVLFIDRDGTLIKEAPPTYQLDDFSKLEFYPGYVLLYAEDR